MNEKKWGWTMNIEKKKDFLINCAYWGFIGGAVYLALAYLLPVFVPVILGAMIAWLVVAITGKLRCPNRVVRILLSVLIYGLVGLLVGLLAVRIVSWFSDLIKWLPKVYEMKLEPFAMVCYDWAMDTVARLNPTLLTAVEKVMAAAMSALEGMLRKVSVIVSSVAPGVPSLILSLLAMIFTTIFLVADYERITAFASGHVPAWAQKLLKNIRIYLTDTLFVVLRSYAAIMMLTFTELSILFAIFGIERPVLKAAVIAVLDILPILGTGAILIPWAIISLMLGYTGLGIELLVIYAIVTVIRNYLEPKIVGGQLGLHPIITLVSMFVGLRLFGFWGLFGTPVTISFLWKQHQEKKKAHTQSEEAPQQQSQEQTESQTE